MVTLKIKETFTTCGWNGTVQFPKTRNAIRDIDLHSTLARMLKEFVGSRTAGFLFQTKVERPLSQSDILNRDLHPILERAWVGRNADFMHSGDSAQHVSGRTACLKTSCGSGVDVRIGT